MKIGSLPLEGHTILAPLAGVTHLPFRRIVKECGVSLVCSEMVSAKGLLYNSAKTETLLRSSRDERPLSVQIFGAEAHAMAHAAEKISHRGDVDIIDINFGCSVRKVVKTGAGVALMKDWENARHILQAVRKVLTIPLTIKIRSGWDASGQQAIDIASMAQDCGVDAVTLHPRTAVQGFRGCADWDLIRLLKQHLTIPVIGNGDILTAHDGVRMMEKTGCDAVMVGRAAMGNPYIFSQIDALLDGKEMMCPTKEQQFNLMRNLVDVCVDGFGEVPACRMMRSRLVWFVKGWEGCSRFRRAITGIGSRREALEIIDTYEQELCSRTR
ncbi:tRNA-U20-dihydrouridine synthase [Desulfocicer vacuolatum DSM 3385]|uniref:tRNA-dihydrouridine synthase n=1 Tax=Desulfocicer vacuolatum DSM 3385 TaxID=1121400 RepID=A0A1W2DAV3_9BACT|nr:tRNA dihydrouridine synthase DusB [Desulfocicer vacuolatum]SMC94503.1 tRNA-U20-dihydrouridine synthase [Desulfocicer vacuolatum DSM 3385]